MPNSPWLKTIFYLLTFQLLHFFYDWLPSPFVAIFSGISESILQHIKIGFFAFLLFSAVELLLRHKHYPSKIARRRFWVARLLIASLSCWMIFVIWHIVPSIRGALMPNDLTEILYAVVATYLVGLFSFWLSADLEALNFSPRSQTAILIVGVLTTANLILLTFLPAPSPFF
jgi:hypothetical protein